MAGNNGSSCCAYGPLLLVPIFASSAAYILTWIFTFDCRFFQATLAEIDDRYLTFGLWTVQSYSNYMSEDDDWWNGVSPYGMCIGWNAHSILNRTRNVDAPLRFASVVGMLLVLIAWILLVFLLFASCMIFSPGAMKSVAWGFGIAGFCSLLCLIALASDLCKNATACKLGQDGIMCIVAGLVWFVAAWVVLYLRPLDNKSNQRDEQALPMSTIGTSPSSPPTQISAVPGTEETTTQETVEPDGTVTVVTTKSVHNADGTTTVTETREVRTPAAPVAAAATAEAVVPVGAAIMDPEVKVLAPP